MTAARRDLRSAWEHGTGKELTVDPGTVTVHPGRPPGTPFAALAAQWRHGAALADALTAALAPNRWDDWSNYNAHRPFPSPRAKHPHRSWLLIHGRRHEIDEVRSTYEETTDLAPPDRTRAPALLLRADPEAVPAGYGELRLALGCLEVGHVAESVVSAARMRGLEVHLTHDDGAAGRPGVLLEFHAAGPTASVPSGCASIDDRPRRCSGLDPRGLAADPRPLPSSAWDSLLSAAPSSDGRLRHVLATHAVAGLADGVWDATPSGPRLLRPGSVGPALERAFRGPPGVADVAGMNVVWGVGADVAALVRAAPGSYVRLLIDVGRAGQQVCRAAAQAGLFCRPVRGVEEPDVEAALGLHADEDLLYLLLIGRPRVRGMSYDLSPACPPRPDEEMS